MCGAMRGQMQRVCVCLWVVALREMTFRGFSSDGSSRALGPHFSRRRSRGADGPSGAVVLAPHRTATAQHSTAQDGPASSPNQDF